jgi:hypothetical protein
MAKWIGAEVLEPEGLQDVDSMELVSHKEISLFFFFIFLLLFICAYKAWFISPPCPRLVCTYE